MASKIDNGFTSYEFTPEDLISAATFSTLQKMYIQTQRAAAALDLLALEFDANNPLKFVEERGFQRGFVAACDFLLDHENAEEAAKRWEDLNNAKQI